MALISTERTVDDVRATFTPTEIVDEALIEALADMGVAEQALERCAGVAVLRGMLADARRSLECVRLCLAVNFPQGQCADTAIQERRAA